MEKKGSLLYDVEENRRRRSVRYQLEQLKQKNDASESEDVENEDDANAASAVMIRILSLELLGER